MTLEVGSRKESVIGLNSSRRFTSKRLACLIIICLLLATSLMFVFPVAAEPGLLTPKWRINLQSQNWYAGTHIGPLVADVNADGKMEIVVTGGSREDGTDGSVTVLDGETGRIIWRASPGYNGSVYRGIGYHTPFDLIDLNRDGIMEIVMTPGNPLVLFGNNGTVYWRNNNVRAGNNYPAEYDVDGDGYPEIFVDSGLGPYIGYDYLTSLTHDGKILHQTLVWRPCWGGLSIGDANFDGKFELYEGDRSINYNPDSDPYKRGGWGIRAFDALTLTPLWNDSSITDSSHVPMLADVDKDGILDVITGNQEGAGLAVYNFDDGSVLTTGGKYRKSSNLGMPVHSQPTVYDLDGDGYLEIIDCRHDESAGSGSNPKIWDLYRWRSDGQLNILCDEPPKLGDVDGDGKLEIIAVNWGGIYIYKYNSAAARYDQIDNRTKWLGSEPLQGLNAFTIVQDVDGDNLNELVVSSINGYVYVFDTLAPAPYPRARSNLQFYSEYKLGAAEYVPPPGLLAPQVTLPSPDNNASNVPTTLTELSFTLTDYQLEPIDYSVTTNPYIGSGSGTNVANGKYSVSIGGPLEPETTYEWTVVATDGQHQTSKVFSFTTEAVQPWWNSDWPFRRRITIDAGKVASNQANFPVLIDLTSGDLSKARNDGFDFVFVDANNVKLNHEIESFDYLATRLVAWVSVPFLSSTQDTVIYMYYGNPAAQNQQNRVGVWGTNDRMVLHMEEKTGTRYDSTSNGNNATPYGIVNSEANGKIDGSTGFDGATGYLEVPHNSGLAQFTVGMAVSFWLRLADTTRRQTLVSIFNTGTNQESWFVDFENLGSTGTVLGFFASQDGNGYSNWYARFSPVPNAWYYVTVVWEKNTVAKFYVNGTPLSAINSGTTGSIYDNAGVPLEIGKCLYESTRYLRGSIDEVRVSSIARSAQWVLTCYRNQFDPSTFYSLRDEETLYVPQEPIISNPSPANGAMNIDLNPTLSVNVSDFQGDQLTVVFRTNASGTWEDLGSYVGGNGVYSQPTSNMDQNGMVYTWSVVASDGLLMTAQNYSFTTKPELGNWWDPAWGYRRTVTVDHLRVVEDQTQFPVLVDFSDASLGSHAKTDGSDIAFVDSNNVKLAHEIESYDSASGHLIAWVKIPLLSSTQDTMIYMYYGNSMAANQQNPGAVWDSDYAMVQHLEEQSGTRYDSTGNANLNAFGGVSKSASGVIDGADSHNGVNGYEKNSDLSLYGRDEILIESWVYISSNPSVARFAKTDMYGRALPAPLYWYGFYLSVSNTSPITSFYLIARLYNSGTASIKSYSYEVVLVDQWVHVAWGISKTTQRTYFYVNGVLMRSDDISSDLASGFITALDDSLVKGFSVGSNIYGQEWMKMGSDELRISDTIRSSSWLLASYSNQKEPADFISVGQEETVPI